MAKYRATGKADDSYKKWYSKEENKEKSRIKSSNYYENNPEKCIDLSYKYKKERMKTDINYKLREDITSL